MLTAEKLQEYFFEDGKPNWERYVQSYNLAYPSQWNYSFVLTPSERINIDSERKKLRLVDYEYAKRGFLKRGGGYRLSYDESDGGIRSTIFGPVGEEFCYFVNREDAENFLELLGLKLWYCDIQQISRRR